MIAVQEPAFRVGMLRERDRTSALVSTWTLTPGGEGERTVVRLAVALRDPQTWTAGWRACRARRALRRLCGQLLEHVDADLGGERSPGAGADRHRDLERPRAAAGHDTRAKSVARSARQHRRGRNFASTAPAAKRRHASLRFSPEVRTVAPRPRGARRMRWRWPRRVRTGRERSARDPVSSGLC